MRIEAPSVVARWDLSTVDAIALVDGAAELGRAMEQGRWIAEMIVRKSWKRNQKINRIWKREVINMPKYVLLEAMSMSIRIIEKPLALIPGEVFTHTGIGQFSKRNEWNLSVLPVATHGAL